MNLFGGHGEHMFGMTNKQMMTVVVGLLLVILGFVSFNYYLTVSTHNGLRIATGAGLGILQKHPRMMKHHMRHQMNPMENQEGQSQNQMQGQMDDQMNGGMMMNNMMGNETMTNMYN